MRDKIYTLSLSNALNHLLSDESFLKMGVVGQIEEVRKIVKAYLEVFEHGSDS